MPAIDRQTTCLIRKLFKLYKLLSRIIYQCWICSIYIFIFFLFFGLPSQGLMFFECFFPPPMILEQFVIPNNKLCGIFFFLLLVHNLNMKSKNMLFSWLIHSFPHRIGLIILLLFFSSILTV